MVPIVTGIMLVRNARSARIGIFVGNGIIPITLSQAPFRSDIKIDAGQTDPVMF